MDRLKSMQVFLEAAERGSLSAAAEAMEMSRAMATRYLDSLEAWLGTRLLHRTTRKLSLTDSGEHVLLRCREMLDLANEVQADALQSTIAPQGKLRITTTPSFAQSQLAKALVGFQALYPKIVIDLLVLDRTVNLVEERIDLAIRISNRVDPSLVARKIAICHSVLCASRNYLDSAGRPATPKDLEHHRYILHSSGITPEFIYLGKEDTEAISFNGVLSVNEIAVAQAAACAGAGIAMLPTFYAGSAIQSGSLEVILSDYTLKPLDIHAVYLSRRHQPKCLRLLIDYLVETFGGVKAPWDQDLKMSDKPQ